MSGTDLVILCCTFTVCPGAILMFGIGSHEAMPDSREALLLTSNAKIVCIVSALGHLEVTAKSAVISPVLPDTVHLLLPTAVKSKQGCPL